MLLLELAFQHKLAGHHGAAFCCPRYPPVGAQFYLLNLGAKHRVGLQNPPEICQIIFRSQANNFPFDHQDHGLRRRRGPGSGGAALGSVVRAKRKRPSEFDGRFFTH